MFYFAIVLSVALSFQHRYNNDGRFILAHAPDVLGYFEMAGIFMCMNERLNVGLHVHSVSRACIPGLGSGKLLSGRQGRSWKATNDYFDSLLF